MYLCVWETVEGPLSRHARLGALSVSLLFCVCDVCVFWGALGLEVGYSVVCAMEVPGQRGLAASPRVGLEPPIPFPGVKGAPE